MKELGIAVGTAHIFGRAGSAAFDTAWIFGASFAGIGSERNQMDPVVAKIIGIGDKDRRLVPDVEIDHPNIAGFERLSIRQPISVEFRGAVYQTADVKLMEVAVAPAEACL